MTWRVPDNMRLTKSGRARANTLEALVERDGGPFCTYCKRELTVGEMTTDHIKARALGGVNARTNLVIACAPCNVAKAHFGKPRRLVLRHIHNKALTLEMAAEARERVPQQPEPLRLPLSEIVRIRGKYIEPSDD